MLGLMALTLSACRELPQKLLIPVPPETVREWVRRGVETPDAASAPEPMRSLRPKSWVRAGYFHARRSVQVEAFGFDSSAGALEAAQKWHFREGAVVRLRGQIFLVFSSNEFDQDELRETARILEAAWFASGR